ncbi:MAG: signal peptide peptidase SppA, partial [Planctomycetota bacterium]
EDPAAAVPIGPQKLNFRGKLLRIRQIAADDKVAGVRIKVKDAPDYAHSLDLLDELRALKKAGKKVVCYAESLDQKSLMFTSLADHLVVPPSGMVALEGLTLELMYLKDLLAKIDAKVEIVHIGEFKTAYEELARDSMSDGQRKVLELLLDEFFGQMCDTIASNRGMSKEALQGLYEKMLVSPNDALKAGLIDAVAYEDEFDSQVEKMFGGEIDLDDEYGDTGKEDLEKMLNNPFAMFSLLPKLLNPPKKVLPNEPRIAVVYATGPIMSGKSKAGFDGTISQMGSETIVKALEEAMNDDWVKAVILRVNSPGGSALASDMIWRATQRVKAKKPMISSMGYVAASGGYWISMGCDRIIAQPSTITGSIGVVSMLPNLSQTLKRFGVNVQVVSKGPHGAENAILANGPTPTLKTMIHDYMMDVYQEFVAKVSEGRQMNPQVLETLARGRVWTGRQALDLNLVDGLGGLDESIRVACELGGGLDPQTVVVAEYPQAPNFFEQLEEAFEDMVTIEGQVKRIFTELGYGDLVTLAESVLKNGNGLNADTVMAVLPFQINFR